jgi:hypothetical protein
MPPKRKFNTKRRRPQWVSSVYNKYKQQRTKFVRQRRDLMYAAVQLSKMPYHLQKFLLSFMYGQHRAELSRLLAATRLQARLRKSSNGRR